VSRARGDAGSGTVLVIGLVLAAVVVCLAVGVLARAQAARGAAQAAADLGALAAARHLAGSGGGAPGDGSPCAVAAEVVAANGAVATSCQVLGGGIVRVTAARSAGFGTASASARAGPRT